MSEINEMSGTLNGTPNYTLNDCVKQLDYTLDAQRGTTIVTEKWIGPTDVIEDLALTWYKGKKFDGDARIPDTKLSGYIQSSVASKMEAERSAWTVSSTSKGRIISTETPDEKTDTETWAFNTAEYDESTIRYLDPTQTEMYVKWENNPNKNTFTISENNKTYYLSSMATSDGELYPGAESTIANPGDILRNAYYVAKLKMLGVTSVKKYYIVVSRTRYGIDRKSNVKPVAKIGTKDDTPSSEFNYTDIDWLYTGFEVQEVNDENYTVVDTWTGLNEKWGGWLDILYDADDNMHVAIANMNVSNVGNVSN